MWSKNKLSCLQPCGRIWCDLFWVSLCVCVLLLVCFCYLQWVYIHSIAHSMNAVKVNNSEGTFDLKPLKLKCHVDCYALHVNMCEIASRCLCVLFNITAHSLLCVCLCCLHIYIFTCCIGSTLIKLLAFGHVDLLQWRIFSH